MLDFFKPFKNSVSGIRFAWHEDKSWRNTLCQFILGMIVSLGLLIFHQIGALMWLVLAGSLFPMLIVETINCSIEAVTDKASPEYSKLAKKAKDLGSASVMLSRTFAIMCWLVTLTHHF